LTDGKSLFPRTADFARLQAGGDGVGGAGEGDALFHLHALAE
jgi:hypothetical protein